MTDIVQRLRGLRFVHVPVAIDLMDEAAAEIERLREAIRRLAEQDATLSVCDGSVTVTLDATLTDAEREAVEFAICSLQRDDYLNERHAEQLQETLERLKERLQ